MRDSNRINTADDIRRHLRHHLAYQACETYAPEERAEMVMYTSTEPCPICAGGMATAEFGRVVYSVGNNDVGEFIGYSPEVALAVMFGETTEVVGPMLNKKGREIYREYGW